MSDQDKGKIFVGVLLGIIGGALLYYVLRCLKNGTVRWLSKFSGGGIILREKEPGWYWLYVLFYAAIAITLLVAAFY